LVKNGYINKIAAIWQKAKLLLFYLYSKLFNLLTQLLGIFFMSKELLRPNQFCKADVIWDTEIDLTPEQLDELSALYTGLFDNIRTGRLTEGTIVQADSDGVIVDIGYKSFGLIPKYEFTDHELKKFRVGEKIEVIVEDLESLDGSLSISYEKAKAMRAWDSIMKLYENNKPVEGIVTHKVKGGLSVDIGIPAFLPGSQVDLQRVTNFDNFVGHTITAHIIKINRKRGNVIISRRKFLGEQRAESRKKILENLSVGQVIQGSVKNITNYGVFIDIGGVDGLLHITDMTWGRIGHPSELVRIGDMVTVKILSFDEQNEKVSLGMKQLTENPWGELSEKISIGTKLKGRVTSITDYGLFVEIAKGIEGLVHVSEISWTDRIEDLNKHFKIGQEIDIAVVSIDKENRRMSLSIKQLSKNPWAQVSEQFKVGQKIKGKITNITDFGIFVQLIPGIDGLVHISDISWTKHINHPQELYKKGDEVDAIILAIDEENKRVSLGVKQLQENPWSNIEKQYPVNSIIEGEVAKLTNFGAFVKLPSGIEGLVHISELSDDGSVENAEDVLKVGEKRKFRVIKVNQEDHKLGLSIKLDPMTRPSHETERNNTQEKSSSRKKIVTEEVRPKSLWQLELEKHAGTDKDKK
jgi:small subunit ribosomal protein S1